MQIFTGRQSDPKKSWLAQGNKYLHTYIDNWIHTHLAVNHNIRLVFCLFLFVCGSVYLSHRVHINCCLKPGSCFELFGFISLDSLLPKKSPAACGSVTWLFVQILSVLDTCIYCPSMDAPCLPDSHRDSNLGTIIFPSFPLFIDRNDLQRYRNDLRLQRSETKQAGAQWLSISTYIKREKNSLQRLIRIMICSHGPIVLIFRGPHCR